MILVLMGVTGSGKSTVGEQLSLKLGWRFEDGDDHHPQSNKEKMSSGVPLNDEDRYQWLLTLHQIVKGWHETKQHGIIVCSALKFKYREVLLFGQSARYHDNDLDVVRSSKVEKRASVSAASSQAGLAGSRVFSVYSDNKKSANTDCASRNSTALRPDFQSSSKYGGKSTDHVGRQMADTEQDSQSFLKDTSPRDNSPQDNSPRENSPWENNPRENNPLDNSLQDNSLQDTSLQDSSPLTTGESSRTMQSGIREGVEDPIQPSSPEVSVYKIMQTDSQKLDQKKVTLIPECLVKPLDVLFVHLAGSFEQISLRLGQRQGHFMNPQLLQSQFQTLEKLQDVENGMVVDITQGVNAVVSDIVAKIKPIVS